MATGGDGVNGGILIHGEFAIPTRREECIALFVRGLNAPSVRVVVGRGAAHFPSLEQRLLWAKELYPEAEVIAEGASPGDWISQAMERNCRSFISLDGLFRAELAAAELMEFPVPLSDQLTSRSQADLLRDPIRHWPHLAAMARPFFVSRVALVGAESTGKSTLARILARRYKTVYTPEFARLWGDKRANQLQFEDSETIVRAHIAAEEALARQANRLLINDTTTISSVMWCHWLYQRCLPWVEELARKRRPHLALLLDTDVPWVPDPQRTLGERRGEFHAGLRALLDREGIPYELISGSWQDREKRACEAVDALLGSVYQIHSGQ